jgi:hypothetical protein
MICTGAQKCNEFLLGADIVQLASDYRMVCIRAFLREREFRDLPAVGDGDEWAHEASYRGLSNALRRVVHLEDLDNLVLLPGNNDAQQIVGREAR